MLRAVYAVFTLTVSRKGKRIGAACCPINPKQRSIGLSKGLREKQPADAALYFFHFISRRFCEFQTAAIHGDAPVDGKAVLAIDSRNRIAAAIEHDLAVILSKRGAVQHGNSNAGCPGVLGHVQESSQAPAFQVI